MNPGTAALSLILSLVLAVNTAAQIEIHRDGHEPQNFPSIQAAIDAAQPSDVILIPEGTYHENLLIREKNGSPEAWFTLRGSGSVTIDGADPELQRPGNGRWSLQEDGSWTAAVPWQGRDHMAMYTWGSYGPGEELLAAYALPEKLHEMRRGSGTLRQGEAVQIRLQDETDPNDIPVSLGTAEAVILLEDSSYWKIENLTLKHGGFAGVYYRGENVHYVDAKNVHTITCYRGFSTEDQWDTEATFLNIRNCSTYNAMNFSWEWMEGYRDDVRVEGQGEIAPFRGNGIYLMADGSEVAHNLIDGTWDGMMIQGEDIRVHHNTIRNIFDDMTELESNFSRNLHYYENIGYRLFGGISIVSDKPGPIYIYRNRVDCTMPVVWDRNNDNLQEIGYTMKFGIDWGPGGTNIKIYHNTFYAGEELLYAHDRTKPEEWHDIEWVNNLFYLVPDRQGGGIGATGDPAKECFWDGNLYNQLALYQRVRGQSPDFEAHGVVADPSLIGADGGDPSTFLRIPSWSPARDRGSGYPSQMGWPDSVPIEDGRPDIGASEFTFEPE